MYRIETQRSMGIEREKELAAIIGGASQKSTFEPTNEKQDKARVKGF
jgi:hypothetical protein